ncbi:hypothetical protein G6011_07992 [Alternaria panax]|uniref:SMP-30/Gluconolactonase/LRE-like region domain-containing protein n=1 Tax=Alternaria panax TaxID=48097 RepID=A0AAD4FB07_9PLEO|nr:hypothetical protein G6011_07992 [Alternaria panax]
MKYLFNFFALTASVLAVNVSTVYQFPNGTWLENISPMRNGSLLVTAFDPARVFIVHPQNSPTTISTIATFPNTTGALGITEYRKDIFAVIVAEPAPDNPPTLQNSSLWKIDMSSKDQGVKVSMMAELPDLALPNGMATLDHSLLLLADSYFGNIVALNVTTGKTEVVLEDPSLASNLSAPGSPLGVNGIKVHEDYVYYSNTVQSLVGRVRIHPSTGKPNGFFETARDSTFTGPDDVSIAKDGSIYVSQPLAAPQGDKIQYIALDGKFTTIAEGELVAGSTASAFGRTKKDNSTLYLTTMGGFRPDGQPKTGGKIVAVKL